MGKDNDYYVIEKINGINRFHNNEKLVQIKAHYKFLFSNHLDNSINKNEVGFILSGKNLSSHKESVYNLFIELCNLKVYLNIK
jgi:hypothetical protein